MKMKLKLKPLLSRSFIVALIAIGGAGCGGLFSWEMAHRVETVRLSSISDFMGCWYVIGSIPNSIEAGAEDSVECYELRSNGDIDTTFTYYQDGTWKTMEPVGRVRWDIESDGGVWGMKFDWWGWMPLPEMAYLILEFGSVYDEELGREVEVSVVGGPTPETLWVMAREPYISDDLYESLKSVASEWYDVSLVERTKQDRNLRE